MRAYSTANLVTPVQSTTTAGDGTYQFIDLPTGDYKIRFTGDVALYQDQWYYFAESADTAATVTLSSSDQLSFIDGYLIDATTSLAGTVRTNDSSAPIQGVTVDVFTTGDVVHPVYSTPTLADGTYEFVGLAAGTYKVRFSPDSALFQTRWYGGETEATAAVSITINPGDHQTGIDGYLPDATMSIAGTIRDNQSVPISGATTTLYLATKTTTPVRTTTTAADGSYSFTNLSSGDYKIRFTA